MIPTNIFYRVIHLAHGEHTATGTMLHVEGREYLATTKHFADLVTNDLDIFHNQQWVTLEVTLVGHSAQADISVLAFKTSFVAEEFVVKMTIAGMIYGEDVYFLGFPFGLAGKGGPVTRGFPIPFVKRGIVANFENSELGADFWLDGHNNVGFSGGPVVSINRNNPGDCTLRGFICSYYTHPEKVERPEGVEQSTYLANSGLIMAANVNRALDLIAANPCGPLITPMSPS